MTHVPTFTYIHNTYIRHIIHTLTTVLTYIHTYIYMIVTVDLTKLPHVGGAIRINKCSVVCILCMYAE